MRKRILSLVMGLGILLTGCGAQSSEPVQEAVEKDSSPAAEAAEAITENEDKAYTPQVYTYEIYGESYDVTYTQQPQRAVTMSQFMTEMLLALELEDRMVGTAYMDNEILPQFKEAYESIEVLSDKYPSKEVLYSVEPDFVSGWTSAFNEKRVASAQEMMEFGIHPYLADSISGSGSMETLYEDFQTLGSIFGVEEKAQVLVEGMKADIEQIHSRLEGLSDADQVRVFAYDSGDKEPFVVAGGGISGDIIRQAKGVNIFDDIKKGYANVSWEEVVMRAPDVIVIVDYGDTPVEQKIEVLKNTPALQDLEAIQNEAFVVIGLADLSPGVRNIKAIETLACAFYPERFE